MIEFYVNLQTAGDDEIGKIKSYTINKTSKEEYVRIREEFNKTKDPYLFFALVNSCMNNMLRFNQKMEFNQSFGKRTINDSTIEKLKKYIERIQEKNIQFASCHYKSLFKMIPPNRGNFVYFDPPYILTEAGYNAFWTKDDEIGLYNLMHDLDRSGIKFAFSGVSVHKGIDNPYMNRLNKYKVINIEHDYEKVAKNKNVGNSQEILVINY